MGKRYTKEEIKKKIEKYFVEGNITELYKDSCINNSGTTKDAKELYIKVIVEYLVAHIDDFKNDFKNKVITREHSYNIETHDGISTFDFYKIISGERREEKIAHAMFNQYRIEPCECGIFKNYQIHLKNKNKDKGTGKIDILSYLEGDTDGVSKTYILELKRDGSEESLLRCILEAYTYSKIVNSDKLFRDFNLSPDNNQLIIAPLVYYKDDSVNQIDIVKPLITVLDAQVECFKWEYSNNKYLIEKFY